MGAMHDHFVARRPRLPAVLAGIRGALAAVWNRAGREMIMVNWRSSALIPRLRQFAAGGTAAVVFGLASTNLLRIISNVTLTRMLPSSAYGAVGVIVSVSVVIAMITDVGLFDFIVRHREGEDKRFLDQLWTIRLIRGGLLTLLMLVASEPAAIALAKPELQPVIAFWSVTFLIEGMSSLAFATAPRQRQVWRMAMMDFLSGVAGFVASLSLALIWRDYWALVAGMLATSASKTALSYLMFSNARRSWNVDRARMAELWGFSRYIAMSSALTLFVMQADKLLLARMMSLQVYGFYALASSLALAPLSLSLAYSTRVLLPAYADVVRRDPKALAKAFYDYRQKVALVLMFGGGLLVGSAQLIVAILYDARYGAVAPFLSLLAITCCLSPLADSSKQGLIAHGETRTTLTANICGASWLLIGGVSAIAIGNIMLLVAVVGTVQLPTVLSYWWSLRRIGVLNLRRESYGLAAIAAGATLGWLVATGTLYLFPKI